jgi:hypothetical protein
VFYHNLHTNAVYVDRLPSAGPRMVMVAADKPTPSTAKGDLMVIEHSDMIDLITGRGFVPVGSGPILARTPDGSHPYALVERYEVI